MRLFLRSGAIRPLNCVSRDSNNPVCWASRRLLPRIYRVGCPSGCLPYLTCPCGGAICSPQPLGPLHCDVIHDLVLILSIINPLSRIQGRISNTSGAGNRPILFPSRFVKLASSEETWALRRGRIGAHPVDFRQLRCPSPAESDFAIDGSDEEGFLLEGRNINEYDPRARLSLFHVCE